MSKPITDEHRMAILERRLEEARRDNYPELGNKPGVMMVIPIPDGMTWRDLLDSAVEAERAGILERHNSIPVALTEESMERARATYEGER